MTEQEFVQLKPGDIVHHLAQPNNIWTVIGKPRWDPYSFIAVLGRCQVKSQCLWHKLLDTSEGKCQELAQRSNLTVTRMINPKNWDKENT